MIKKFGPFSLVDSSGIIAANKLIFHYRLRTTNPVPSIEIYGTTYNGLTNVLAKEYLIRSTSCSVKQELTEIISFDPKDCVSIYFVINNYESFYRLYGIKMGYSGVRSVPAGSKATGDIEQCIGGTDGAGISFRLSSYTPDNNSTGVSTNLQPTLAFSKILDMTTLNSDTIEFWEDDGSSEMTWNVLSGMSWNVIAPSIMDWNVTSIMDWSIITYSQLDMDVYSPMKWDIGLLGGMDWNVESLMQWNVIPPSVLELDVYSAMDMNLVIYSNMDMNIVSIMDWAIVPYSSMKMNIVSRLDWNVTLATYSDIEMEIVSSVDWYMIDPFNIWTPFGKWNK